MMKSDQLWACRDLSNKDGWGYLWTFSTKTAAIQWRRYHRRKQLARVGPPFKIAVSTLKRWYISGPSMQTPGISGTATYWARLARTLHGVSKPSRTQQ